MRRSIQSLNSTLYECPTEYMGKKVEIRHPSDKPEELFIYEEEKPKHKLKKIDIYENANTPAFGKNLIRRKKTMIRFYYGLNRMPFQKNIAPKEILQTESGIELRKRFEHIQLNRGVMLITGNPGTGKTVHTRGFVQNINANQYKPFWHPSYLLKSS